MRGARIGGLAALLALLQGPALALSCVEPDLIRAFHAADQSELTYVVLHGRLDFDPAAIDEPEGVLGVMPEGVFFPHPATFTGEILRQEGFVSVADIELTVNRDCLGIWCGGVAPDSPMLIFARSDGEGWILDAHPCQQWVFDRPSPAQLAQMVDCINGNCPPAP